MNLGWFCWNVPGRGPVLATIDGSMPEPVSRGAAVCTPKFWIPDANVSPRSRPTCAKVVLHETMKPSRSVPPHLSLPKFPSVVPLVCGSGIWLNTGNVLSTSTLFCSATDAVTVLNVEPGGYSSRHERASNGLSGEFARKVYASCAFLGSCVTSWFGSKVGFEKAAKTPPVCTFNTTTLPRRPCNANAAALWATFDIVSTTVPTGCLFANASARLFTWSLNVLPSRSDEYVFSTPTDPFWID